MKNHFFTLWLSLLFAFACTSKEEEILQKPLSEQNFEFEIYDSLVVDYLGNLILMDISPDQNHFLLIDQNTDSIFVTNPKGEIQYQYKRTGEGPEMTKGNRIGIGKFLDDQSFLIPGSQGLFVYSLSGKLEKSILPDFKGVSQLVIPSSPAHAISNGIVFVNMPGRYSDLKQPGTDFQKNSKSLELVDLITGKYESVLRFPKESKFSSETQEYGIVDHYINFAIEEDSIYVAYRNEPKLFVYHISNLNAPVKVNALKFPVFIERNTESKPENEIINIRDLFLGAINRIIPLGNNLILINYLAGLSDEVAKEIIDEAGTNFDLLFEKGNKKNTRGMVLFNGSEISQTVSKPTILGNVSYVASKEEIWFSPDFEQVEKDYSVIYKTRLISK